MLVKSLFVLLSLVSISIQTPIKCSNKVQDIQLTANNLIGFDSTQSISLPYFQCLNKLKYDFFIARSGKMDGKVDDVGIQNLVNAKNAGFTNLDVYMTPCNLSSWGLVDTACSENLASDIVNKLEEKNITVGRIWIDIETGYSLWGKNQTINFDEINEIGSIAMAMLSISCQQNGYGCNTTFGIYTSEKAFETLVGDNCPYGGFNALPLWWVYYDGHDDFKNFKPFGGWTTPTIHQYAANTYQGQCGVTMNLDWA